MNDSPMTIRSILPVTASFFRQRGIESSRLDAEVLLGHVLGMSRVQLYVNFDQPLQKDEVDRYRIVVKDRARRVPVAYIVGSKEFMSLDLFVGPGVLVPRPDTEIVVEALLHHLAEGKDITVVDIGTGSGAIAIAIAVARPRAVVYAIDSSPDALLYCHRNVDKHGLAGRVIPLLGDLLSPIESVVLPGKFDAIVSNPPYIVSADIPGLQPEVSLHEPKSALDGGTDGLKYYRDIVSRAPVYIMPGGCLALEVGQGQATDVAQLVSRALPDASLKVELDYAGVERAVLAVTRGVGE